jgi:anthranilate synthase component 1
MMPFVTLKKLALPKKKTATTIPDVFYAVYQNIIAINHFKNEAYLFSHSLDESNNISEIEQLLQSRNIASYKFSKIRRRFFQFNDEEFRQNVALAKKHCLEAMYSNWCYPEDLHKGFKGDEFNVYRALRSINPSPYLFFFDYGNFKIFGSSPEAQLVIKNQKAEIHPIAGTFKRTGNDEKMLN